MGRRKGVNVSLMENVGKAFSVYLNRQVIVSLEDEIFARSKPIKGSRDRVAPKGLTVSSLIAACVEYVIGEGKLKDVPLPSAYKRYYPRSGVILHIRG